MFNIVKITQDTHPKINESMQCTSTNSTVEMEYF
jgi:hypothetical protein